MADEVINWANLYLAEDPFRTTPPSDPAEAKWAGMSNLCKKFERILQEATGSARPQFVLNWGPYGSGKTHASLYFRNPANIPLPTGQRVQEVHSLYVQTPKEPTQPTAQFYVDVMEQLDLDRARQIVNAELQHVGDEGALQVLRRVTGGSDIAKAILLLGSSDRDVDQLLLSAYFLSRISPTQQIKLGLARSLASNRDRARVLAGLLQSFVGLRPRTVLAQHSRIILWIDEAEDLTLLTAREYTPFSQTLRDLWDRVPAFLTIFMNFTLAGAERDPIETVLGKAIMSRVTHEVYFASPSPDEALEYASDLLTQHRSGVAGFKRQRLPDTYPFDQEALKALLSRLSTPTPRSINLACRNLVLLACREGKFSRPGDQPIDAAFVQRTSDQALQTEIPGTTQDR